MQRATQDTNYDLLAGKAVFTLAPHLLILSLFKRGALFQGIQNCCRLRAGLFFSHCKPKASLVLTLSIL